MIDECAYFLPDGPLQGNRAHHPGATPPGSSAGGLHHAGVAPVRRLPPGRRADMRHATLTSDETAQQVLSLRVLLRETPVPRERRLRPLPGVRVDERRCRPMDRPVSGVDGRTAFVRRVVQDNAERARIPAARPLDHPCRLTTVALPS